MRILIIEDDQSVAELERDYLEINGGFQCDLFSDGTQGLQAALKEDYALVIVDVMLPGLSGFEICRRLREEKDTPVIIISALADDIDKVRGLGLGADDYITKPFLPQELLLRLAAVLRRVYGAGAGEVLRLGAAEVHWGTGTVRRPGGGEVALTAKEYALLKKLAANRGNIVTIDALCQALWEGPMVGYENTLMVHIRRLREKLETDPSHPQYLLTVRGLGYRLAQEERP